MLLQVLCFAALHAGGGKLELIKTIQGSISPKSIVASGTGLFFAQNMMYTHKITVYDRGFQLIRTLSDQVNAKMLGKGEFKGTYRGSPVECAIDAARGCAWISNYQMYGRGFSHPGFDRADNSRKYDSSYLYRVDLKSLRITDAVRVGSVPKYVAVTPDTKLVLVSNWVSYDLSVVDAERKCEVRRVKLGRYPRGIVVDQASRHAYVALLGGSDLADVDLHSFKVSWIRGIGLSPRHLCLDPNGRYVYATLNGEGRVAKVDLGTRKLVSKVATGVQPRSMTMSPDGAYLFVVNYGSNTVSAVRTSDMSVVQTISTSPHPIGITYDAQGHRVWVACYSGCILVYRDGF